MVKKQKTKKILFYVCLAIFLLSVSGMTYTALATNGYEFNSIEIESEYVKGSTLDIPVGYFCKGTEKETATHIVLFPDGRKSSANKVKLDMIGEYMIEYTCPSDVTIKEKKAFNAINEGSSLFTVKNGTAKMSNHVKSPINSVVEQFGTRITALEPNTKLELNGIVDLNNLGSDSALIEYIFSPSMPGSIELSEFDVILTDIYDEQNSVSIRATARSYQDRAYITAAAKSNKFLGVTTPEQGAIPWGVPVYSGFYGHKDSEIYTTKYFFDVNTQIVNASPYSDKSSLSKVLVLDLDQANETISESNVFKGFTSNEVKISLSFPSLLGEQGSIIVYNIAGISLGRDKLEDTQAPIIKIDFGKYIYDEKNPNNSTLPYGIKDKPYKIFSAYAYDMIEGELSSLNIEVFDNESKKIDIKQGCFTPKKSGMYSVHYSITDNSKNASLKIVKVLVKDAYDENLSFIPQRVFNNEDTILGTKIVIGEGTIYGGSGEQKYDIEVKINGEKVGLNKIENNYYFELTQIGTYDINYILTDYLDNPIIVTDSINAVDFMGVKIEPETIYPAYQKGIEYPLPIANVSYCENGSIIKDVVVGTSSDVKISGNTFVPNNVGEISFTFSFGENSTTREAKVIDTNSGSEGYLLRFFDIMSMSLQDHAYGINFETTADGNYSRFINPVIENSFKVDFEGITEKCNFEYLNFTIYDSKYSNQSISISLKNNSTNSDIYINNEFTLQISKSFEKKSVFSLSIKDNKLLDEKGNILGIIKTYDNGEIFNGFESGKVLFGISFSGVTGVSAICLKNICNQSLSNTLVDRITPYVLIEGKFNALSYKNIGDKLIINRANVFDVLQVNSSIKIEVTKPNGSIISYDNASEIREIIAEEYGDYSISYIASDGRNEIRPSYVYTVRDVVPPVIKLDHKFSQLIALDSTITLSKASVIDDSGYDPTIYCYIIRPNGLKDRVENGGRYKFTEKGMYRMVYYANDAFFNLAQIDISIKVA